jgi:hypothetical protein
MSPLDPMDFVGTEYVMLVQIKVVNLDGFVDWMGKKSTGTPISLVICPPFWCIGPNSQIAPLLFYIHTYYRC